MRFFEWLRSIFSNTHQRPHDYIQPPLVFPQLDAASLTKRLKLVEQGTTRGALNLPSAAEDTLDNIENSVATTIQGELQVAQEKFSQYLRAYGDRQTSLQVGARLSKLETSADETCSQFFTTVRQGRDEVFHLEEDYRAITKEYDSFRAENHLNRLPHYPRSRRLHWSIIFLFVVVETALNGTLLAVGNVSGLVGGFGEALVIALVNVVMGVLLGGVCLRFAADQRPLHRVVSYAGLAIWLTAAVLFNLTVAHYRAALGGDTPAMASRLALTEMAADPFGIQEVQGWLLLALGLAFNLGAAFDRWKMDDPYPGYGPLARRKTELGDDFLAAKLEIAEELQTIRDQAIEQVDSLSTEIEFKVKEYGNIDQLRHSVVDIFKSHLHSLEQCGNDLLSSYRQANIGKRTSPAPDHFSRRWTLPYAPVIPQAGQGAVEIQELQDSLARVQGTRRKILEAYQKSLEEFRAIEDLAEGRRK